MNTYKITINPLSPFGTPLQSDTIFGQCVWILRYLKGNDFIQKFLDDLKQGKKYFVVSSGFLNDEIILPMIPINPKKENEIKNKFEEKLNSEEKSKAKFLFYLFKKQNKRKKIKLQELFENLQRHIDYFYGLQEDKIDAFLEFLRGARKNKTKYNVDEIIMRNSINRRTNTVNEGNLFSVIYTFYKEGAQINIYVKTDYFNQNEIREIFDFLGKFGFGADSSTGKGLFSVEDVKEIQLPSPDNPNYILSISNYIPDENETDLSKSYYDMFLKQGKLGGEYSSGIGVNVRSYIKTPLLMIKESALLKINEIKEVYGKIETNVNKYDSNIIHTGQIFDIKLLINEV